MQATFCARHQFPPSYAPWWRTLIQMPLVGDMRCAPPNGIGKIGPKFLSPASDHFVAHHNSTDRGNMWAGTSNHDLEVANSAPSDSAAAFANIEDGSAG
jgi:hypothetical protein